MALDSYINSTVYSVDYGYGTIKGVCQCSNQRGNINLITVRFRDHGDDIYIYDDEVTMYVASERIH